MPTFDAAIGPINYIDLGQGEPVVLIHGFSSSHRYNWGNPGWVDALIAAGRRVVALDVRGHGDSVKLYDPADYSLAAMAGDVRALVDHLGLGRVDAIGYSMGARILTELAVGRWDRLRTATLGGMGAALLSGTRNAEAVASALETPNRLEIEDAQAQRFRAFAEQTGSDLRALAACMRSMRRAFTAEDLGRIAVPTLIAVGTLDVMAGSARELAALIPDARVLDIANRDHMQSVGDPAFKRGVIEFIG